MIVERIITRKLTESYPNLKGVDIKHITKHVMRSGNNDFTDINVLNNFVVAYARHEYTGYDDLLNGGMDRVEARRQVYKAVHEYVKYWSRSKQPWMKK